MSNCELYGWPTETPTTTSQTRKNLSAAQQKERIAILLRQPQGASVNELMEVIKCTAAQARGMIRQIIDDGGDIVVKQRSEDGQQIFNLKN
jgi:archaeosine-15-forming tRNA-guanine transglycosylase